MDMTDRWMTRLGALPVAVVSDCLDAMGLRE